MERGLRSYVLRRLGFAALMLVGVSMILSGDYGDYQDHV